MKKRNKKRAFITSIIMLLISAIVLTSSTFAWFVMGDKAEIEEMDIKLYSSEGIQISANATDESWRQYLTLGNIFDTEDEDAPEGYEEYIDTALDAYSGNRNMLPTYLKPASSSFNTFNDGSNEKTTDGYPTFYRAKVEPDGSTTVDYVLEGSIDEAKASSKYASKYAALSAEDAKKYNAIAEEAGIIAFDIFIKSPAAQTIDFSNTEIKEIQGKDKDGNPLPLTNNTSAIRYAFVPMGTVEIGTAATTIQQLKDTDATKVTIAEAESLTRSDDAKNSKKGANAEGHIDTLPLNGKTATEAQMKNVIVTEDTQAPKGKVYWSDDETKTFDLAAGITKIRVYVWAEGNDVDCRDSIASSELSVAIKFAVAA